MKQRFKTTPSISARMSHVPQKRGNAERLLAKALWHDGYRYYLNYRLLPGSPDIAIPKYRIAIFVDGAFWHGYHWSEQKLHIKANREYWINKIESNMIRDSRNDKLLEKAGWTPLHFWEKEVKRDLQGCLKTIESVSLQTIINRLPCDLTFSSMQE